MSVNVDAICPPTPGLERLARSRTDEIVKEFGRRLNIWGTSGLHGPPDGALLDQTFSIGDLATACYAQGVRDAIAVAADSARRALEAAEAAERERTP